VAQDNGNRIKVNTYYVEIVRFIGWTCIM